MWLKKNRLEIKMEAQFNDLCRRMLQFDRPQETEPQKAPEEEKPKISRRERRENERRERKKEKKEKAADKKTSSLKSRLETARVEHRLSQFDESDRARIEKVLFNK